MGRLDGKVCLITGGARGQGAAEAALFVAEGAAAVYITDVLVDAGEKTAADTGATFMPHDVSDADQWAAVVERVVADCNRLDVLVNNAAIFEKVRLLDTTLEFWNRFVAVNQTSVFLGMQSVAPTMMEQGSGSIINLSSIAGLSGSGAFAYGATKWAVRGLTKCAAHDLGPYGIRVNSIHPGVIDTEMIAGLPLDKAAKTVPLGRCGTAHDVAQLALWLASDESAYASGAEFVLDGGGKAV
jgi:3alpha(or 20beta)-hydroxysteroid dehydrogenase